MPRQRTPYSPYTRVDDDMAKPSTASDAGPSNSAVAAATASAIAAAVRATVAEALDTQESHTIQNASQEVNLSQGITGGAAAQFAKYGPQTGLSSSLKPLSAAAYGGTASPTAHLREMGWGGGEDSPLTRYSTMGPTIGGGPTFGGGLFSSKGKEPATLDTGKASDRFKSYAPAGPPRRVTFNDNTTQIPRDEQREIEEREAEATRREALAHPTERRRSRHSLAGPLYNDVTADTKYTGCFVGRIVHQEEDDGDDPAHVSIYLGKAFPADDEHPEEYEENFAHVHDAAEFGTHAHDHPELWWKYINFMCVQSEEITAELEEARRGQVSNGVERGEYLKKSADCRKLTGEVMAMRQNLSGMEEDLTESRRQRDEAQESHNREVSKNEKLSHDNAKMRDDLQHAFRVAQEYDELKSRFIHQNQRLARLESQGGLPRVIPRGEPIVQSQFAASDLPLGPGPRDERRDNRGYHQDDRPRDFFREYTPTSFGSVGGDRDGRDGRDGREFDGRNPYDPRNSRTSNLGPRPRDDRDDRDSAYSAGIDTRYRIPDVDTFHGRDDEDYEHWRQTVYDKIPTIPTEALRIAHLRGKLKDYAGELVRRVKPETWETYIYILNGVFDGVDKHAEAETALADGSLKMKWNETLAGWQARFSSTVDVLELPDNTLCTHAYRLLKTDLANKLSTSAPAKESFPSLMSRARMLVQHEMNINLGKLLGNTHRKPAEKKGTTRKGDSSRKASDTASRTRERRPGYGRTPEERTRLGKLGLCFKCGEPKHRAGDPGAPCENASPTPSNKIAALSVCDVADALEPQEQVDEDGFVIEQDEDGYQYSEAETESLN